MRKRIPNSDVNETTRFSLRPAGVTPTPILIFNRRNRVIKYKNTMNAFVFFYFLNQKLV